MGPAQKIRPITDAAWSACFSAGSSRSTRAATTACTVSGTAKSEGSSAKRHEPFCGSSNRRSISVPSSSSTKNGFPSARCTTTSRSPAGNRDPRVREPVRGGGGGGPVAHIQPESQSQDLARAETFEHPRRRVALEDPEMFLQHLRERPVRDALAVGETPSGPPQRLGRAVAQPFPEFAHDPCLADPRISEDRHELRFPPVLDLRVGSLEHLHLFVTAHEGPAKASDTARTHERKSADEASALDPSRLPLGLDRLSFPELERATRGRDRSLADEDLARLRGLLQSRCNVDRIARDEGTAFARLADDDLTRVDPDPQRERLAEEFVQTPLHRQRPMKRSLGVILER